MSFRQLRRRLREWGERATPSFEVVDALTLQRPRRALRQGVRSLWRRLADGPAGAPARWSYAARLVLRGLLIRIGLRRRTAWAIDLALRLTLLAALCYGSWRGGRWAWREWSARQLFASAVAAEARGDLPSAAFALRSVLAVRPGHVPAHEMVARVAQGLRDPQAVTHRRILAELDPRNPRRQIDLAEAALAVGQFTPATAALDLVPEAARGDAAYHRLRAEAEIAAGRFDDAERSARAALALVPDDPRAGLQLAVLLLLGPSADEAARADARARLTRLAEADLPSIQAARVLAATSARGGDRDAALRWARVAAAHPHALIGDQILLLNMSLIAAPMQADAVLGTVKARAARDPADALAVCRWLLTQERAGEAGEWIGRLPETIRALPPILMAQGDAMLVNGLWPRLEALAISRETWGEYEPARLAFAARSAREQGRLEVARGRWSAALRAAGGAARPLQGLVQIAGAWKWTDEQAEARWALLVALPPDEARAQLMLLFAHYRDRLDAAGLRRTFEKIVELRPDDTLARRSLTLLYLLGGMQVARAREMSLDLYTSDPVNLDNLLAYAWSQHAQGRTDEALALLDGRPREDFAGNAYAAGYYGMMMVSAGRRAEAAPLIEAALKGRLLPEETALLRAALDAR